MGILLAALAAAGDSGVQSMNQNIDQMNKEDLQAKQSDLELQKAKAMLDYKNAADLTQADQQRAGVAGRMALSQDDVNAQIIKNAMRDPDASWVAPDTALNADGTAPDNAAITAPGIADISEADRARYAPTQQQTMRLQGYKLIAAGDVTAGDAMLAAAEKGTTTLKLGDNRVDADGNTQYDNGKEFKQEIEDRRMAAKEVEAQAKLTAAANKGKAKALTPEQTIKIEAGVSTIVQKQFAGAQDPYANPGATPAEALDNAKMHLAQTVLSTSASNAVKDGKEISPNTEFTVLKPVLDRYDTAVQKDVKDTVKSLFQDGVLMKSDDPAKDGAALLANMGIKTDEMTSPQSVSRALRAKLMQLEPFQAYNRAAAGKPTASTASTAASALARAAPSAVKRGILAAVATALPSFTPSASADEPISGQD